MVKKEGVGFFLSKKSLKSSDGLDITWILPKIVFSGMKVNGLFGKIWEKIKNTTTLDFSGILLLKYDPSLTL